MTQIVDKARQLFYDTIKPFQDVYGLVNHLPEMEKWARFMIKKHDEADAEVILLSVWLHDIGHYPVQENVDHAVTGEKIARAFLEKEGYDSEKILKVLHCVRAHRCRDVMPNIIEAKIIACIDSASHMTDSIYFDIARNHKSGQTSYNALEKIERDYRDISVFPEIRDEMQELYDAWKKLLVAYNKINIK